MAVKAKAKAKASRGGSEMGLGKASTENGPAKAAVLELDGHPGAIVGDEPEDRLFRMVT